MELLNYKQKTTKNKQLETITRIPKDAVMVEMRRVLNSYTLDQYIEDSTLYPAWKSAEVQKAINDLYCMLEIKMITEPALQPNIVREQLFKVLEANSKEVFYSISLAYIHSLHKQLEHEEHMQEQIHLQTFIPVNNS